MKFWLTHIAQKTWNKYKDDSDVHSTFVDLLHLISEGPNRGARLSELPNKDDKSHKRAIAAIDKLDLTPEARVVLASLPAKPNSLPPRTLAIAFHTSDIPDGIKADHTILAFCIILRNGACYH